MQFNEENLVLYYKSLIVCYRSNKLRRRNCYQVTLNGSTTAPHWNTFVPIVPIITYILIIPNIPNTTIIPIITNIPR